MFITRLVVKLRLEVVGGIGRWLVAGWQGAWTKWVEFVAHL